MALYKDKQLKGFSSYYESSKVFLSLRPFIGDLYIKS